MDRGCHESEISEAGVTQKRNSPVKGTNKNLKFTDKSLDFWESLRGKLFIRAYTWALARIYDIVLMFRCVFHKGLTYLLPQQCLNVDTKKAGVQIVTPPISVNFTLILSLSA